MKWPFLLSPFAFLIYCNAYSERKMCFSRQDWLTFIAHLLSHQFVFYFCTPSAPCGCCSLSLDIPHSRNRTGSIWLFIHSCFLWSETEATPSHHREDSNSHRNCFGSERSSVLITLGQRLNNLVWIKNKRKKKQGMWRNLKLKLSSRWDWHWMPEMSGSKGDSLIRHRRLWFFSSGRGVIYWRLLF